MYRCHHLPVPEAPRPFLAAVDVLELGIVLCQSEVTYFWSEERSQP